MMLALRALEEFGTEYADKHLHNETIIRSVNNDLGKNYILSDVQLSQGKQGYQALMNLPNNRLRGYIKESGHGCILIILTFAKGIIMHRSQRNIVTRLRYA